jgi:hypothetical protein
MVIAVNYAYHRKMGGRLSQIKSTKMNIEICQLCTGGFLIDIDIMSGHVLFLIVLTDIMSGDVLLLVTFFGDVL